MKIVVGVVAVFLAAGSTALWWTTKRGPSSPSVITSPTELASLEDHEGKRFSFDRLKGRTVVMNFIFTHCPVSCPMQTKALTAVQQALPKALHDRVRFVSVTMDPTRDTPPVLRQYGATMGADLTNWSFVTGQADEIAWLHKHYNAQVKATDGGQFDHRVAVYLLDANRNLIQTYTGDFDQVRLVKEIGEVDGLYNKS